MKHTKNPAALRILVTVLLAALTFVLLSASFTALAQKEEEMITTIGASPAEPEAEEESGVGAKAIAAGIAVGLAAAAGAIGMAIAVAKSVESIARQPEASGKINSTMMLGLVFIETAILYALIIAILVIFVL